MKNVIYAILVLSSCGLLSACVSAPTYGTDKTATAQLFDDLGNMASIGSQKGEDIVYNPRPDIVPPPDLTSLPEPQTSVAANEQIWPESPEETRARLIAEIDANQDNPRYVSPLADANILATQKTKTQQQAEYREARKIKNAQYSERRFLSDPPAGYRVPASTAPIGELGETEFRKEKNALAAASKAGTGKRWWEIWKK